MQSSASMQVTGVFFPAGSACAAIRPPPGLDHPDLDLVSDEPTKRSWADVVKPKTTSSANPEDSDEETRASSLSASESDSDTESSSARKSKGLNADAPSWVPQLNANAPVFEVEAHTPLKSSAPLFVPGGSPCAYVCDPVTTCTPMPPPPPGLQTSLAGLKKARAFVPQSMGYW